MTRLARPLLLILVGCALLHVTVATELYLRYVKEGLRLPLIVSGAALAALGLLGLLHGGREKGGQDNDHGDHEHSDHDHTALPRTAWLMLLPALLLLLHPPAPLGSYTAGRDSARTAASASPRTPDTQLRFAPMPAGDTVPMPLSEFTLRAQHDRKQSLKGRTVQLTGFVTPGRGGSWQLTRLVIACCAADSQARKIEMHGVPAPPADTWVTVTGRWHPRGTLGTPAAANALDVTALVEVPQPASPYTDTVPGTPGYG
ncbi:TIGR03943 family protein [Streptomyces sp. NPDC051940]|uniref:TIGR03943 family putative permease subunit n=1 Tax=Streptomyces sp. NPDC051940 TaxID=3155675 RepID=UPI00341614E8